MHNHPKFFPSIIDKEPFPKTTHTIKKGKSTMKNHTITLIPSAMLSIGLLLSGCGNTALPEKNTTAAPISELSNQYPAESTAETAISSLPNESTAETAISEPANESAADPAVTSATANADTIVSQGGPYGKITLSIPDGWRHEICPIDSKQDIYGLYGIRFYPKDVADGYIALNYIDSFGVCGTGLEEKNHRSQGIRSILALTITMYTGILLHLAGTTAASLP